MFFCIGIVVGMLKFHWDIVWSFHYRYTAFFIMCSSSERSVNYGKKDGVHVTVNVWSVKSSEVHCDFCGLKVSTRVTFRETYVACMGKTVWTVATSPTSAHFSRWKLLEKMCTTRRCCDGPVFPIHTTHVPVHFTQIMTFILQNRTTFPYSSHVDDSNIRAIFVA